MGAKIYNSNLTKQIIDGAKLQLSEGGIPSEIAEKVIPTMEVNPNLLRTINYAILKGSTGTVYTVPDNQDFYLVAATMQVNGTTTANNTLTVITENGTSSIILYLSTRVSALIDIDNQSQHVTFPIPMKIKRGSNISFSLGSTLGNVVIFGYSVDNPNA